MRPTINAFTVDLEDWYHVCGVDACSDPATWASYERRITGSTAKILSLLRRYGVKATFFVLGYIAANEPALIKEIAGEGHELATHGFFHRRVYEMSEMEFDADIGRSIEAISTITKAPVLGFRAPEWSIRRANFWAFDVLRRHGIEYDSSLVPMSFMGCRDYPRLPVKLQTRYGEIVEFPLTTARLFHENVPFSGGLPLRIAPYFYVLSKIQSMNRRGIPAVVYTHPWEFDTAQPKLNLPLSRRFMHYFNIGVTGRKVEGLLKRLPFAPMKDVVTAYFS
ncbi:polysaccharide deacetylase family protein [Candidatus Magnetominusculus dajiuhuensis]|uniref:polysaccharide deacetylase family protein n=1 Tax=Candidatus Magnetominusculus dajiuhuensis TaxID=3137712 RepID=UPI003B427F12